MIDFENSSAFTPFHTETAIVSGKRRENGATRDLGFACCCCLLVGELADTSDHSFGSKSSFESSIDVMKSNWPDHLPPQKGDVFEFVGRGSATVSKRPVESSGFYVINCLFKSV